MKAQSVAIDISLVRNLPLFRQMEPAALTRLMVRATPVRILQGDTVFEQGGEAVAFYLLLHGRLKVSQVTPDGQQVMVRVVHPGDLFGFARALAPKVKVNAIAPALLLFNDHDDTNYREKALQKSLLQIEPGAAELSNTVMYLLSSRYITGKVIGLDGGRHLNLP